MNTTNTTIITLLRVALSGKAEILPTDVNWGDVIEVAAQHGVLAICFDALEILKKASLNSKLSPLSSFPDIDNLMDWLGQTSYQEKQYEHNREVACRLADLWHENNISTVVLKGRSIAQYYPKPCHRYSCDLDVLIPSQSEWDKACQILESKGIALVHEVYKEVEFTFDDVYVECHRYITPFRRESY